MLKRVVIARDPLDTLSWEYYDTENVCQLLTEQFDTWPDTARIYYKTVSMDADITPSCEADIKRLQELDGPFYVVVYPAGQGLFLIVMVIISVVMLVMTPTPPNPVIRNTQQTSPNNELSERGNKSRPNGRIPDIYGTVRSTPDLLSVPYKIFIDHEEVEYSYMCIGRGTYDVSDIRDGKTLCTDIGGTSVEVYGPNTSPNSGSPQLTIGDAINVPVLNVYRSNSVNGQVLRPPNTQYNTNDIKFNYPNEIQINLTSNNKFKDLFEDGDEITISNTEFSYDSWSFDLNGTYIIDTVTNTLITLVNPAAVNASWGDELQGAGAPIASTILPLIVSDFPRWVGPFTLDSASLDYTMSNFVALNGLYKDNGQTQQRFDVTVEVELTPVDGAGDPIGSPETFQATIPGSAVIRDTRALTLTANPTFTGLCKVRARRVTDADLTYQGQVVDEVKWRDIYTVIPVTKSHFGNITTVQSVTKATAGALAVKERKLNMLVTRKLPARVSGSTFTSELYATNNAADIISAICLDQFIGNRTAAEIDFDNIYATVAAIEAYFGSEKAAEFNYTFDNDNLSFEETVSTVASAVFSVAYRLGNVIKLSFEKETDDSTLLFNHRNKIPGSETRTVKFGNSNDNDGVEYEYVSPDDDAVVTYYIPTDKSAVNPKKIESIGVRNPLQAYFQAWRIYNKMIYQNTATEFEATQEADLLVLQDRILVADNTRPDTQDGEVLSQNVLELTLSQNVDLTTYASYVIFLQHIDGTVESISITEGSAANKVVLAQAPRLPLALDSDLYARTTYIIVGNTQPRQQAFLVAEKTPQDNMTSTINAINYDSRYYGKDLDYINGIVNENGEVA